jgi:hypothetical protein
MRTPKIVPSAKARSAGVHELEVLLLGVDPPVRRRIRVPSDARLDWLHAVLQVAMGWTNSHLHQFRAGDRCYTDTRERIAEFEGDPDSLEEREFTLEQIAPREKGTFAYDYDFGDSWTHKITVARVVNDTLPATTALGVEGEGACPPEDCGGPPGYEELCEILKNPKHPEYKSTKEWLGREFDPAAFDVEVTNRWLGKLKWPRVTEVQLSRVISGLYSSLG